MIDLNRLEQYRENNRIEAKRALGGLPHSIWETYSAFANTLGGLILLGVEEYPDKSLHPVDLPDPEGMVREFRALVSDPQKASVNVLGESDVRIETVGGDRIIVIRVPRAARYERPVFVDGNPRTGTYRRSGEGDYRCSEEELQAMYRDAERRSRDMLAVPGLEAAVLCGDTLRRFRERMSADRPGYAWIGLPDEELLERLGAAEAEPDGTLRPTAAGLLMFGGVREIRGVFPRYELVYREEEGSSISSASGDWSGNVFDFYFRVHNRLQSQLHVPGEQDGAEAPVRAALREALANCLINADYRGQERVEIVRNRREVRFTNPGGFRVNPNAARTGGVSDARNAAMQRMFGMIDIGEGTGSGIPSIFQAWRDQGWPEPVFIQRFAPEATTLTLAFSAGTGKRTGAGDSDNAAVTAVRRQLIIEYLTDHVSAGITELAAYTGLRPALVREYLSGMISDGLVVAVDGGKARRYRLRS